MKKINSRTKRLLRNRSKLKKVNVDRYRIAVYKSLKNISAVFLLFVIILSVCIVPYFKICDIASWTFLTVLIDNIESKYSVPQSFSLAILSLLS